MSELSRLHEAITATIKAAMPQLETVGGYTTVLQDTTLPALCHTIIGLKPSTDPGDGHSCILATFEARIAVDGHRPQAALESAELAAQLMVVLRKQYWGIDFVEEAHTLQALPQVTDLPTVAWVLQWQQVLHLGEAQWHWPNQPPGSLVFAFDPDSGPGKEGDYKTPEDFA